MRRVCSSSICFLLFLCVLPFQADCHLAAFVSSEGKPGSSLVPRPIRGPTKSPFDHHPHLRGEEPYFRPLKDEEEEGPTFVPYIGPRALGNVRAYLTHIQENLAALQSLEDLGENSEESGEEGEESQDHAALPLARRYHARRHILPEGGRRLVGGAELPLLLRRAEIIPSHHPSWSYTRSGLG